MIESLTVFFAQKPLIEWGIMIAKFGFIFVPVMFILFMITLERRGAGFIQDRQGPNRTGIPLFPFLSHIRLFGIVQNGADGLKLFTKELFEPREAHGFWFKFAPAIPFMVVFLSPAVIPWFGPMVFDWGGQVVQISGSILNLDVGVLLLFAFGAISVYGSVLGSWASNSKYALLGGMRAGAMMISYEISMGLSLLGMYMLVGSFNMQDMVAWQETNAWGIFVQPIAFVVFLVALVAETGRAPFDVAEGESELVSGFHTEFSGMRFAMFYMGEYAHIAINAALLATLFLGGYSVPFVSTEALRENSAQVLAVVCGMFAFGALAFLHLMHRYAKWYKNSEAADKVIRLKEWGLYKAVGWLAVPALVATGAASFFFADVINANSFVAAVIAAAIQVLALLFKMSLFCWLWIWLRWTLPRFRYDHVMHLGWIILLNVALVNLVITAIVVKLFFTKLPL
ncbi:MAG: NADH-quinone oxidoreductase subunit H [Fibromonadaceae bacterium]|jgi:NADH-quinone oxidoreductase subunit H|nr:NADH-quinone oxidoreductase subunit H [Fibromonadaceae bacterium]